MAPQIRVYSPVVEIAMAPSRLAPRLASLAGKRIAFIHNGWQSLDATFAEFARYLSARHAVAATFEVRKAYASRPLPNAQFRRIAQEADASIIALGN